MDSNGQTSLMFVFGMCFAALAGILATMVFVVGLALGGISATMYLPRFKAWLSAENSQKDEKKKKGGKGGLDLADLPPLPGLPTKNAIDLSQEDFNDLDLPTRQYGALKLREKAIAAKAKSVYEDALKEQVKRATDRAADYPRPDYPGIFDDPFAGTDFAKPQLKKGRNKFPYESGYGTAAPFTSFPPRTPEEEKSDPFNFLGKNMPHDSKTAFARHEMPPPGPPPEPKSSFLYDPFASLKPPPPPEAGFGDPFAGMDFPKVPRLPRSQSSSSDSEASHRDCCCCCERKASRDKKSKDDDDVSCISKSYLSENENGIEVVEVVGETPKIKVSSGFGSLSESTGNEKDILTPDSSAEAAELLPSPEQVLAAQKADEKKKLVNDVVKSLQTLLEGV